jgi:cysteine desulfurase
MNKQIYLDNSSTTPLDLEVLEVMKEYYTKEYGNPGSMHTKGLIAAHGLNLSRQKIAKMLNCSPEEIIFTSSGTESNNLAIKGLVEKYKGKHIITTKIEHHAVLDVFEYLEKKGVETTYIDVEKNGIVNPEKIKEAIRKDTVLISVMYANNEIGTIQPIEEISKIAKEHDIVFHTDACQAGNSENLDVKKLGIDLMTLNGSKIYGPKGAGCLYKKDTIKISPQIHGGGQEFNIRSGTENTPSIVGFTRALEKAQNNKDKYSKLSELRDYLIEGLLKIPNTVLNGDAKKRLPNNVNVTFLNVEGESILLKLDDKGICASSGSACTSRSLDPSHVILAIGMPQEVAHGAIRFSLGKYTTKEEVDYVLKEMPKIIQDLRAISPVKLTLEDLENA